MNADHPRYSIPDPERDWQLKGSAVSASQLLMAGALAGAGLLRRAARRARAALSRHPAAPETACGECGRACRSDLLARCRCCRRRLCFHCLGMHALKAVAQRRATHTGRR